MLRKISVALTITLIVFLVTVKAYTAPLSVQETYDIGTQAYIYAYPLVLMEITREKMTNVPTPITKDGKGGAPINQFVNLLVFPNYTFKGVVRPNVDTLYTMAWLELAKEPIILSVPDTQGRYYLMEMLDAWTNVFAAPGKRTTGTKAENFVIVGPTWHGALPNDLKEIKAPTNTVWIIGRTQTNNVADYKNVNDIQKEFKLTPLSAWNKSYTPPKNNSVNHKIDMKTPPVEEVKNMSATEFFTKFAEALKENPPVNSDASMVAQLKQIGIVPGQDFNSAALSPTQKQALDRAIITAQEKILATSKKFGEVINGWSILRKDIGTYGTHYLDRAVVAFFGLGANLPEDAIYPTTYIDSDGKQLNGQNHYVLHFAKDQLPPVNAFWSVTMYDHKSFLVKNSIDRYALGDRNQLNFNQDGSLDIYLQHESPGKDKEANWLPAPKGDFNLTMRLYWPKAAAIEGKWNPPPVQRTF